MRLTITRTTALFPTAVFVQWNVEEPSETFSINVERAGSLEGPWDVVGISAGYHYLDAASDLNLFSLSRNLYYRISIPGVATSAAVGVEPGLDTRTRLFKRKILHDEAVGFRHLNGIALLAIKRRRWGERCTYCYDPATKESTEEHCPKCYGTTYLGGYWAPVGIRGRRDPAPVQAQMSAHGVTERRATNFTILDYPHLERGDLLVDLRSNDRWIVEMMSPTEMKGVIVHQKLACSDLSRNSVEYLFPVDPLVFTPLY